MSDEIMMIRVLGFKTKYERLPVKGDPLDENIDERGYKVDAKGKRVMENVEVDWVQYAPSHSPVNTATWERVRHVEVTDEMLRGEETEKLKLMKLRWSQIAPAYSAWKSGNELPVAGTPLAAWAGVTAEKAEVLRSYKIRTVEEVARLAESQLERIPLPGMRDMRKQAALFLEGKDKAEAAVREAERDAVIAALQAQLAENNERLSAAMDLLDEKTRGEPTIDDLRAELDDLGVTYHHKAGVATLKGLLADAKADKEAA